VRHDLTINSLSSLSEAKARLSELWRQKKYLRLQIHEGRDRSLGQNALLHAWIQQIARETGEDEPEGIKAFIKLHFGVPLLRAENDGFRKLYDENLKRLPYEQKLSVIRLIPVTSIMTTAQLSEMLTIVQGHYASRDTDPVILEFPSE
jgi:hypothetical protein